MNWVRKMLNEYENEINVNKEILSTLPKNNIKNRKKVISEIEKMLDKALSDQKKVFKEIEERHRRYCAVAINPEIEKINGNLQKSYANLYLLNETTTSYEKSGLDHIFYRLDHFYEENIDDVNNCIIASINVFKKIGLELTDKHFSYSIYTLSYMKEIFAHISNKISGEKLKETFDALYWKCPDIIKQITINFKYLYYLNKKKFDEYYTEEKQKLFSSSNMDSAEILENYIRTKEKQTHLIYNDKYLILNKFINRILDLKDYTKEQIEKNYRVFINPEVEINDKINENILKLQDSLNEYKSYLKYKYIIDDIKKLYSEKDKYVKISLPKKKELDKLEKNLISISKKLNKLIIKNKKPAKIKNITNKVNVMISQVESLYKEYEENLFLEKIATLDETTSIKEALEIGISNYRYIIKLMKNNNEGITLETINKEIEDIRNFLINNELSVLNNIYITDERDLSVVIKDKYNLFGLDIKKELLEDSNLDSTIKSIDIIVNSIYFNNQAIDINNIKFVCNSMDLVEKKD